VLLSLPVAVYPERNEGYSSLLCSLRSNYLFDYYLSSLQVAARISQFNFFKASLNFPIISLISSFLQVPTLNLYQDEFLSAPKA
jgi:hypothetical protein